MCLPGRLSKYGRKWRPRLRGGWGPFATASGGGFFRRCVCGGGGQNMEERDVPGSGAAEALWLPLRRGLHRGCARLGEVVLAQAAGGRWHPARCDATLV